jgi:hypothetical protein
MNALRNIRDGGSLKKQSDFASWSEFYDQDVTEILRFSSDAEPDDHQSMICRWRGVRGHWPRVFACAVLLRSYADPEVRNTAVGDYNNAMIHLIESVRHLDAGLEPETMAALAWFIMKLDGDPFLGEDQHDQRVFAGIGILSIAIRPRASVSQDTIMKLADWLIAEEKNAFDWWGKSVGDFPNHWLFRTTFFSTERTKWMAIGAELAAFRPVGACGDAVRRIGRMLSGETPMP